MNSAENRPNPMRTLVVHTGGIGDFLLACPAIAHLAEDGPVELLGRDTGRLALAVAAGLAEAAHSLERVEFDTLFSVPSPRLKTFLEPFDRAVVWMRDPDGVIQRAMRGCGITRVRAFPGLPPNDWPHHASRYYLECVGAKQTGLFRLNVQPSPEVWEIVIHSGSGGRRKNWPRERFEAVATRLVDSGHSVYWLLGPAEEEVSPPPGSEILREDSLVALAGILASTRVYLGNDSGISHLAAAVGCRVMAVFGPTNPAVWAPLGDRVDVLQGTGTAADDWYWPEVETVLASLYHHLI